ncbi:MAG: orotidine-5'-phosphate decarboxylase [Hyphomicrobiaceae bacterium]|nr:orotidine-5'-phosphate decarboxylase [Hyphomicrobiaceae bacterium]
MPPAATARERLIVGLDVPDAEAARAMVRTLGDAATFYKVGLELVMRGGLRLVEELVGEGRKVFLDMKLLDIPNTVERAVRNAAATGATFLTVHATDSKTLRAAAEGAAGSGLRLLGVTVLTSLDAADLAEQGIARAPQELVLTRARLAKACGLAGIVASGHEAKAVRDTVGPGLAIVTPGIRFPENEAGDQARVTPPGRAIADGADHLVVARPIIAAADPRAAAQRFVEAIAAAQG